MRTDIFRVMVNDQIKAMTRELLGNGIDITMECEMEWFKSIDPPCDVQEARLHIPSDYIVAADRDLLAIEANNEELDLQYATDTATYDAYRIYAYDKFIELNHNSIVEEVMKVVSEEVETIEEAIEDFQAEVSDEDEDPPSES